MIALRAAGRRSRPSAQSARSGRLAEAQRRYSSSGNSYSYSYSNSSNSYSYSYCYSNSGSNINSNPRRGTPGTAGDDVEPLPFGMLFLW